MSSETEETVCPSWRTYFLDNPNIVELSDNRIMLTGKCRWCFGTGRVYSRGDYESCRTCNSGISGYLTFIVSPKIKDEKK